MVEGLIVEEISDVDVKCVKVTGTRNVGQGPGSRYLPSQYSEEKRCARHSSCRPYVLGDIKHRC